MLLKLQKPFFVVATIYLLFWWIVVVCILGFAVIALRLISILPGLSMLRVAANEISTNYIKRK